MLGAGPAGLAAALTLQRYSSTRVCLMHGGERDHPQPGETVSSALHPLMAYLGASEVLSSEGAAMPGYATHAAWGGPEVLSRDTLFTGRGEGLLLDRLRFDEGLLALFERQGGEVLQGAWMRRAQRQDGGWQVAYTQGGQEHQRYAAQVIDATGRRASFARRAGAEPQAVDALVGVVMHMDRPREAEMPHGALIESVPDGWWYSAPLPGHRAVVAFMTDADLLSQAPMPSPADMLARMPAARHTSERLRACTGWSRPRVYPAATQALSCPIGEGWVAAGDTALALDPLSSLGIGHALTSGIQAARIAQERLDGDTALAGAYASDVSRHLQTFLLQWRSLYAAERRWAEAPFWRRRQAA